MQPHPQSVAPARASLGISAKSVHAGRGAKAESDPKARFLVLDQIQRVAQSLLFQDQHRICTCQRNMQGSRVGVHPRLDGSNARFSGLITCGDVWVCPTCSEHVAEPRRLELQLAIRKWKHELKAGDVYLMTLTAPHTRESLLEQQLDQFASAMQRFKNSRAYKRILGTPAKPGRYRRQGSVKSLETTWGENGWHPHVHEIVFCGSGLLEDYTALEELRQEWVRILLKVGLGDSSKRSDMLAHAFDVRGGDYAADYVAKYGRQPQLEQWGITDELTRSHAKRGQRLGHMTPFALLRAYAGGDLEAGALFREFAQAFAGKRMLTWSPGLKAHFGILEATDEDLARSPMPDEAAAFYLEPDDWKLVISRNARGEMKYWAAKEGEPGARAFLEELRARPPTHRSGFLSAVNFHHRRAEVDRMMHPRRYA
jgi:hypothetical protein